MIIQSYWNDGITVWIYALVLGALALRVLYQFFTAKRRKRVRKSQAFDSGGSTSTIVDNNRYSDDYGVGGGDGGGDGGGGGGD